MIPVEHPPMRWAEYDDDLSHGLIGCDALDADLEPEDITITTNGSPYAHRNAGLREAFPRTLAGLEQSAHWDGFCYGECPYGPGAYGRVGDSQFDSYVLVDDRHSL